MNQEQKRHLHLRIHAAARAHLHEAKPREKEPAEVKRARAILSAFNNKVNRVSTSHRNAVSKAEGKAREVVLFGSVEEALAAVKAFEKRSFK